LSEKPTEYQTFSFVISEMVSEAIQVFGNRQIIMVCDNHTAHSKSIDFIKSKIPHKSAKVVDRLLLFNLAGYSQLNAIEGAFSKPKQDFYYSGMEKIDLPKILSFFNLKHDTIQNISRNYVDFV
jgi:hypothetical protein